MSFPMHFSGRSRENQMTLARDYAPTRDNLLDDARRRRQERAEAQRRQAAAERIQRAVRVWLSRRTTVCRAAHYIMSATASTICVQADNDLQSSPSSSTSPSSTLPLSVEVLRHTIWCLSFIRLYEGFVPEFLYAEFIGTAESTSSVEAEEEKGDTVARENTKPSAQKQARAARRHALLLLCADRVSLAAKQTFEASGRSGVRMPAMMLFAGSSIVQQYCIAIQPSTSAGGDEDDREETATAGKPQQTANRKQAAVAANTMNTLMEIASMMGAGASSGTSAEDIESSRGAASFLFFCLNRTLSLDVTLRATMVPLLERLLRASGASGLRSLLVNPPQASAGSSFATSHASSVTGAMGQGDCEVIWQCLTVPSADAGYLPLSDSAVETMLDIVLPAPATSLSQQAGDPVTNITADNAAFIATIVETAYQRVSGGKEKQEAKLQALSRLARLLPYFLHTPPADSARTVVRKKWLLTIAYLCESVCRTSEFVQRIVHDLHHTTDSGHKFLVSYLFSSTGGLKLLEQIADAAEELTAQPAPATTSAGVQEPEREEEESSELGNDLEIICGVYAWPLLYFSTNEDALTKLETAAIFSRLVRSPRVIRQLWCLYRSKCVGLRAVLPPGDVLRELCVCATSPNVVVRLPAWAEPPISLVSQLQKGSGSFFSGASTAGLGAWRHMYWEPHPQLAILFFSLLSYYVGVVDVLEDLEKGNIFTPREELYALLLSLKEIAHRAHFFGVAPHTNSEGVAHLACALLGKLHVVNEALQFVPYPSLWISTAEQGVMKVLGGLTQASWRDMIDSMEENKRRASADDEESESEAENQEISSDGALQQMRMPGDDAMFTNSCEWTLEERVARLLYHVPFAVPFPERAALLTMFLLAAAPQRVPGMPAEFRVQRGRVFEDVFAKFHSYPEAVELMSARFSSVNGALEEGYGQGVYREMMVDLCREGFAPEHGLFARTEDGFYYPNPASLEATGDPLHLRKIAFLGSMVGRALMDGILQETPFALHFRNSLLGRRNTVNNLKSFDPQLYRQMVSLLSLSDTEMESMCLTFSYSVEAVGVTHEVELVKGGSSIAVNRRNCMHYIHLVADYKLNREGGAQTNAFKEGLQRIILPEWLHIFDSNELLNLFGGDRTARIDIADWKKHTVYHKEEDRNSTPVRLFWEVVETLTREQQCKLLKFATSMNRPPLLGFRFLSPPFKIHMVTSVPPDRLPTASTCFSTLHLPPYNDYGTARAKIVAAIEETESFELS